MSSTATSDPTKTGGVVFAAPDITEADIEAVSDTLRSGWLTTGEQCNHLEQELGHYLDIPHVVSMSSCTAALETAFAYLDLPEGARVGVPTWTFVSSALAPAKHGAVPVLLDVDPDTLNVSPASVEAALDEGLSALVVVHFGGLPVDELVYDLCEAARVPVVEDAAHALGTVNSRGRVSGKGTVAACYSFYATKNLTTGEGGALATTDDGLADFARSYRLHGLSRDAWSRYRPGAVGAYDLLVPGIKANLSDVMAALARSQLRRLDDLQARRRCLVGRYRQHLSQLNGLRCVPEEDRAGNAHHLMVVVLPEGVSRDHVVATMRDAEIGSSVHFQPLHSFEWFRANAAVGPSGTSTADSLSSRVLSLPLHTLLSDSDVDRVCEVLEGAVPKCT